MDFIKIIENALLVDGSISALARIYRMTKNVPAALDKIDEWIFKSSLTMTRDTINRMIDMVSVSSASEPYVDPIDPCLRCSPERSIRDGVYFTSRIDDGIFGEISDFCFVFNFHVTLQSSEKPS